MCGIVGYIGKENAAPVLLDGLAKLIDYYYRKYKSGLIDSITRFDKKFY